MIYRVAADAILLLHLAFIVWVVFGSIAVRLRRWWIWLHAPAVGWAVLIEFMGWPCPLTPLEQYLRQLGGQQGFEGGFIEHYIGSILYPEGLGRGIHIALGVAAFAVNALGYWWAFSRQPPARGPRA